MIRFLLTRLIAEKLVNLKQHMEIMGLNDIVYWVGWFITYALMIIVFVVAVLLIGSTHIWKNRYAHRQSFFIAKNIIISNLFLIFLLLYLYGLSLIGMTFVFSVTLRDYRYYIMLLQCHN